MPRKAVGRNKRQRIAPIHPRAPVTPDIGAMRLRLIAPYDLPMEVL
jgi:hypothetical protein